jgi:hypothetical protein
MPLLNEIETVQNQFLLNQEEGTLQAGGNQNDRPAFAGRVFGQWGSRWGPRRFNGTDHPALSSLTSRPIDRGEELWFAETVPRVQMTGSPPPS